MNDIEKFWKALRILKADVECNVKDDILTEDDFNNNIEWITGTKDITSLDGHVIKQSITTTTCPHSEITWTKLKAEMDKL